MLSGDYAGTPVMWFLQCVCLQSVPVFFPVFSPISFCVAAQFSTKGPEFVQL